MQLIRYFLPGVCIRVRLDGGFAHPQLLAFLDAEPGVEYVVAMAKNAVLKRKAKPAMRQVRKLSRRSGRPSISTVKPTMRPERGRENAASSSKPRWCVPTARSPKTTRALSSPT